MSMIRGAIHTFAGSVDVVEVFNIPEHYQEFEDEQGHRVGHGWYWWFVKNGCPDSYAVGPFNSSLEAVVDSQMGHGSEHDGQEEMLSE